MRDAGDQRDRAVVWLTILGAFASPIFFPLTAWLVHALGCRGALRVHAALTLVIFTAAALASPRPPRPVARRPAKAARATRSPPPGAFRRWIAASMIGGAAIATGGALGPLLAGVLLQTAHSYIPALLVTVIAFLVAAATIATGERPQPTSG